MQYLNHLKKKVKMMKAGWAGARQEPQSKQSFLIQKQTSGQAQ